MSTIQAPLTALFIFLAGFLYAQQVPIEGFVYESDNRGYLKKVHITATGSKDHKVYLDTFTNAKGVFKALLPSGKSYKVVAEKKHFFPKDTILHIPASAKKDNSFYLGIEMLRKPGYIFDVTMASKDGNIGFKESIQGARIEIYNNTTQKEELALKDYPYPNFKFTFENGNHYTIMIRKKGFFNKRMEAYINVEGCILCFEGLGLVDPGVTDVMTNNNQQGTFLANVELQPAIINKTIRINNIYYDYDQSYIRPDAAKELDKLVYILKDNPAIKIELGS
ncbi:MAG TPA: hypothetical protein ENJ45_03240, partial [Phaeodactylibacter sp.]|nr:hypothetical protein [Phaeodactylibacter sp.]